MPCFGQRDFYQNLPGLWAALMAPITRIFWMWQNWNGASFRAITFAFAFLWFTLFAMFTFVMPFWRSTTWPGSTHSVLYFLLLLNLFWTVFHSTNHFAHIHCVSLAWNWKTKLFRCTRFSVANLLFFFIQQQNVLHRTKSSVWMTIGSHCWEKIPSWKLHTQMSLSYGDDWKFLRFIRWQYSHHTYWMRNVITLNRLHSTPSVKRIHTNNCNNLLEFFFIIPIRNCILSIDWRKSNKRNNTILPHFHEWLLHSTKV